MRDYTAGVRNWQGVAAVLLAALVSVSCGGVAGQSNAVSGNNPANLTLNTSSIDFGSVAVGSTKTSPITLTNASDAGSASVTFSQVNVTGTGFSASTAPLPIALAPGQSSTITLTFAPKSAGTLTGSLSITVVGAADPAVVALTGVGVGVGQLAVSPATLNFGSVAVGSSQNQTGTLIAGSSNISVSSAAWTGQGYSLSGISFPVTIQAGKSLAFTVTFAPQAAGSAPGSVSFLSNATNSPTNEAFTGTGTQSQAVQHTVHLSWSASTSSVAGYYVYRGTVSGGPYSKLNSTVETATAYADSTVQSGSTYYYVVTSVDSSQTESGYSNQVSANVPTP
jgi:Abnormal spindle-like microcephaly-assoc'd, ASPM-SPD-2-Hydin